ncbi:hypothetical protein B566_EDAN014928 [Ephemera danica]|nr:hypothetical protein B566_EDAN014928 [Ephemera danica]
MTHAFVHWQSKAKHPRPTQPHALTQCIEEIQQNITGNVVAIDEKPDDEFDLPVKSNEHSHGHSHSVHGHSHAPANTGDDTVLSNIRNVLTIMALSFHCIFEGIAVGIQDTAGEVWTLFGAISSHKFVIAFCVGWALAGGGDSTQITVTTVVMQGWALAESGGSTQDTVATVVMQGMAAGTIVYVTFFEILQREKNTKDNGFAQLAAIMIGFIAMIGLMALATPPTTPTNFNIAAANNS